MQSKSFFTALAAAIAVIATAHQDPCVDINAFSLKATDGKTYTKTTLCAKPTIVLFLSSGCPHNPKATPDFNKLKSQLGSKVNLIAVTNLGLAEAKAYGKKLNAQFPIIADQKGVLINMFGAKHSLDLGLVCAKDQKIAGHWEGYSKEILEEIVTSLPHHGGPTLKLDYSKYPKTRQSGCSF